MLKKDDTGLIIVDIQGKLANIVNDSERLINNCKKLILGAQVLNLPIVWLEQNPEKLGATEEQLSRLLSAHKPITKYTFNSCNEPEFVQAVKDAKVTNWLVCGIEAHICIYQTVRGLIDRDYQVHLVTDCISSRAPENKALALTKIAEIGGQTTGLEMCLYELVEDCRSEAFRPILHLIK